MINLFSIFGLLILPKIGCPVNFWVVLDDQTKANFEQCIDLLKYY